MSGIRAYDATGLVEEWDNETRTYTDHRTGESRPYTEQENAAADASQEQATAEAQHAATSVRVDEILDHLQIQKDKMDAVIETDNETINANPAYHVKEVARAVKQVSDASIDLAKFVKGL